jgi:hypothetical protein
MNEPINAQPTHRTIEYHNPGLPPTAALYKTYPPLKRRKTPLWWDREAMAEYYQQVRKNHGSGFTHKGGKYAND